MASKNEITGKEAKSSSTTATNGAAAVTLTAPTPTLNTTNYVDGVILSASGAIAAPVQVTLAGCDGGTINIQLPATAIAPVVLLFGVHPLRGTPGTNVVLTLPALGSGIVGTATLLYHAGAA